MRFTRRDFLKAASALAAALGLEASGLLSKEALAKEGGLKVVWLHGQGCNGDSISVLNSITYQTIDDLLLNTIDLEFHATLMAAAGREAVKAAHKARVRRGYVLVVEGAIPTGEAGEFCYLWPGMTAADGIPLFAANADAVLAVGTCACFGGVSGARGNVTGAQSVGEVLPGTAVINIPGCPAHPDWVVGTIAYLIANGHAPPLDAHGRPTDYFGETVHDHCPDLNWFNDFYKWAVDEHVAWGLEDRACLVCHDRDDGYVLPPRSLGNDHCLFPVGCRGRWTHADCPTRQWNSGAPGVPGVNWCVGARSPCQGCTEPEFPDGMSPFFTLDGPGVDYGVPSAGAATSKAPSVRKKQAVLKTRPLITSRPLDRKRLFRRRR